MKASSAPRGQSLGYERGVCGAPSTRRIGAIGDADAPGGWISAGGFRFFLNEEENVDDDKGLNSRGVPWVMESTKECAAEGCHEQVGRSLAMCTRHWKMVPKRLKVIFHSVLNSPSVKEQALAKAVAIVREYTAVCPSCGRLIGSRSGTLYQHPEGLTSKARARICPGSGIDIRKAA